jgi:4-aminobutyrate aminotransferase-like enzyme
MRFAPPLIITREIIDEGLEIFEGAVKEVATKLR